MLYLVPVTGLQAQDTTTSQTLTIEWLQSDAEPFFIARTETYPYGGLCDTLVEEIIRVTPQINHIRTVIPQARISKALDEGHTACFPCMIHRVKNTTRANYSIPTVRYPPFVVIATPAKARVIRERYGSPVELSRLLADSGLIRGQHGARKLPPELQHLASSPSATRSLAKNYRAENETQSIIDMLEHGYIDYTLDYPFVATYFNRELSTRLEVIPFTSAKQLPVFGAVGCATSAPNDFARQALSAINKALQEKVLQSPRYLESLHFWHLTPPADNPQANENAERKDPSHMPSRP